MISLFYSPCQNIVEAFQSFLYRQNADILFTVENENKNGMSFLDEKVISESKK